MRAAMERCPFCRRVRETDYEERCGLSVAFAPLNPVTEGHLLVVPVIHVAHALADASVTGKVMRDASEIARRRVIDSCNIITSVGQNATQTVQHFHVHIVPRRERDGLKLPWTE